MTLNPDVLGLIFRYTDFKTVFQCKDYIYFDYMYVIKKLYCEKHSVKHYITKGDLETLKIINEYFPIKRNSEYMSYAAKYGHLEILKYLHNNISIQFNRDQIINEALENDIAEYFVFIGIWKFNNRNLKRANIYDKNTLELNW